MSIIIEAEFSCENTQSVICVLNGKHIKTALVDNKKTFDILAENLQSSNHLRFYCLENYDSITLKNLSLDGLDFFKTVHFNYMHNICYTHLVDPDGTKYLDTIHKGSQLDGPGFFRINFEYPVDRWFFLQLKNYE